MDKKREITKAFFEAICKFEDELVRLKFPKLTDKENIDLWHVFHLIIKNRSA